MIVLTLTLQQHLLRCLQLAFAILRIQLLQRLGMLLLVFFGTNTHAVLALVPSFAGVSTVAS